MTAMRGSLHGTYKVACSLYSMTPSNRNQWAALMTV